LLEIKKNKYDDAGSIKKTLWRLTPKGYID
jgi:hypothetical protein